MEIVRFCFSSDAGNVFALTVVIMLFFSPSAFVESTAIGCDSLGENRVIDFQMRNVVGRMAN